MSNSATSPGAHRDVVVAEDQPHAAAEHVQPLVAAREYGTRARRFSGGIKTFQALTPFVFSLSGMTMRPLRFRAFGLIRGIADLGCADELVERHAMRFGDREQQLEARFALAGLESRERALRNACDRGEISECHSTMGS